MRRTKEEIEALAKAHADYLVTVFYKGVYDGFIHGYKHGAEYWKKQYDEVQEARTLTTNIPDSWVNEDESD